jgi:putative ABC transport system permease protein
MHTLLSDLRFGVRMLWKNPAVAFIAVLALALGIGANTAIFTVVNAVMLGSLPYASPEQLVTVWEKRFDRGDGDQNTINLGNFSDWKQQNKVFSDMAAFIDIRVNLTGEGSPEEIPGQWVTTNLLPLLGVNPIRGRLFAPEEGKQGQANVAVISYSLWQRRFGGDDGVVGRTVTFNNLPNTIIGVLPEDFSWHVARNSRTGKPAEVWLPWQISQDLLVHQGRFACSVARLKPGVSVVQAQSEMDAISARLRQQYPEFDTGWGVNVVPLRTQFTCEIRKPLLILLGAVALVLLIACANVANLLLARAASRKKEIAVRTGLGASRWRIVRQLLTESILLSALGGFLGLALAWWGTRALIAIAPPSLSALNSVQVSLPVLGFTLAVSLLTGIVFGMVPALEAAHFNLQESLKEGGKNIGGSSRSHRFRNVFVVTQVALALVLLIGAGLLIKSLKKLQTVDPGFNPNGLLTMRVSLPALKYDTDPKTIDFFNKALEQIRALPGVDAAAVIDSLPFTTPHSGTGVEIEGEPKRPAGQELITGVCVTSQGYFDAMQIPLKQGRIFTSQEAREMRHVVVINEEFARRYLPGQNPIGKRVTIDMKDENVPSEIIGVVGDNKHLGLDQKIDPMSYWPHPELVRSAMTIVVRTKGNPTEITPSVRSVIRGLDPDQPISDIRTMEDLLSLSVARSRFSTTLLTVFSFVALVMAAVGVYGVVSYSVLQRTHEIGVRVALGAQQQDVLRLIFKQGFVLGLIGVAAGLAASFGLTRLMTTLLFEVEATDKIVFVAVSVGAFLITIVACYIPARRAMKVDPLQALRYE